MGSTRPTEKSLKTELAAQESDGVVFLESCAAFGAAQFYKLPQSTLARLPHVRDASSTQARVQPPVSPPQRGRVVRRLADLPRRHGPASGHLRPANHPPEDHPRLRDGAGEPLRVPAPCRRGRSREGHGLTRERLRLLARLRVPSPSGCRARPPRPADW